MVNMHENYITNRVMPILGSAWVSAGQGSFYDMFKIIDYRL